MATSRQGRRRIVVDSRVYYWKHERLRDDVPVNVCSEDALERGHHGCWLRFRLPYRAPVCAAFGDAYVRPVDATPGTIRRVLVYALHQTAFDGPTRPREIVLDRAAILEALAMTRDELVREDLLLASAALAADDGRRLAQLDRDLATLVRFAPSAQVDIDDWLACHPEELRSHAASLRSCAFLRACCERLAIELAIDLAIDRG